MVKILVIYKMQNTSENACASHTRGLIGGGATPTKVNTIYSLLILQF